MHPTRYILVLGASGMLGSAVRHELTRCDAFESMDVDVTQKEDPHAPGYLDLLEMPQERWADILQQRPYHYIVNCIGILKPAVNEQDPASVTRAIRVNALFPHALAQIARKSRIIHLSTDGVGSIPFNRPYRKPIAA